MGMRRQPTSTGCLTNVSPFYTPCCHGVILIVMRFVVGAGV